MSHTPNHPKPDHSHKVPGRRHGQIRNGFGHHAPTRDLMPPAEHPTPKTTPTAHDKHEGGAGGKAPATALLSSRKLDGFQKSHFWLAIRCAGQGNAAARPTQTSKTPTTPILPWFLATWFLVPFSHAAINASQTLILQTGGIERARITSAGISATAFIGNGSQLTNLPPATVAIGNVADITTRTPDGFWQTDTATIAEGWPADAGWYHLLSTTHNNMANYYSMQFAGDFYNSNNIFYRTTSNVGTTGWNRLWHSGNDGTGSGLDADTVDGLQASNFTRVNAADIDQWQSFRVINNAKATAADGMFIGYGNTNGGLTRIFSAGSTGGHYYSDISGNILRSDGATYWHSANDGTGSGLDADTVDGVQLANLVRNNANSGMVPGTSIRFGHANQTNIDDGTIGAGIHASGLNIVGTQTVGGEGRTIRMWGNTAIVGSIVADGTIKAATPVANDDLTTKAYVDTAIAAAAGGRPTYMGVTASAYTGNLGGNTDYYEVHRGNMLCAGAFAGSRMLLSTDIARTDFSIPPTVTARFHCDDMFKDNGFNKCAQYPAFNINSNCLSGSIAWNSTSSGDTAFTLGKNYYVSSATCNTPLPVHCVKD